MGKPTIDEGQKKKLSLKLYEPAMCCATGVCGPNVDARLVALAGILKKITAQGICVERFNLAQQPQAFMANERVKAHLAEVGHDRLPFIYINDELKFTGRYPESAELAAALDLDAEDLRDGSRNTAGSNSVMAAMPDPKPCCSEGCC